MSRHGAFDDALIAAARNLKWKHDFSKPHDPQRNGLIESHVGIVKSGARAFLYQAGMPAMCRPWAVKYFCQMKSIQDRYNKYGNVVASSYCQRCQINVDSIRVPFGALIEFLPSSPIQKETTSKIAPNTIPGTFIGYYEDIHGLSKDYVVISFAFLGDAKAYPNDRTSWRVTHHSELGYLISTHSVNLISRSSQRMTCDASRS